MKPKQKPKTAEPPIGVTCHYERGKNGKWWVVWSGDFIGDKPGRMESPQSDYLEIGYQQCKAELATTSLPEILADYKKQWIEEIEKHSHIRKDKWTEESPMIEIREIDESWWQQFKKG
jgi:hypothetical protein